MKGVVSTILLLLIFAVTLIVLVYNYSTPIEQPTLRQKIVTGRAIYDIPYTAPSVCVSYHKDNGDKVCDDSKPECPPGTFTESGPYPSVPECNECQTGGFDCSQATTTPTASYISKNCKNLKGSCVGKICGKYYNDVDKCGCDDLCETYSDCYPDYLSICKNGQPSKSISQVPTPDEQSATDLIHSIDLSKGENMIGYPLNEEIPVEKLKNYCPLEYSDGYYFWTYEGDTDSWVPAEKLQPRKAYRVNSKEDCSLFLIGAGANFEKLSLSKGWNLITSPKLSIFNNVLGTCKGKLDDEHNVIGFDEETKNQVQKNLLEPNKAYWVFAKSECELDFSSNKPPYTTEGQIKEMSFSSNALKENRKYNVYLPPNYYTSSSRYPVLYLFHGAGGDHNIWIKKGKIDEHIKNLFQDGQITEIILVMPDDDQSALENGCSGLGVDIKNPKDVAQRACGNYEDFIVNDLIPHIDSTYRTIADKSARGFLGFSTGAHGAYWIAFRHPQLVSFVAGYSGYYQEKSFISGPLQYTSIDDYRSFRKVEIPPKDEISHMTLYLEVGKYDVVAGAGKQNEKFHERLKKAGIPHTYLVTPAGINQIYVHGEGFLRDNMDKAIVLFSKDIAEPIKLVQYKVP